MLRVELNKWSCHMSQGQFYGEQIRYYEVQMTQSIHYVLG